MVASLDEMGETPVYFADCCVGISKPLLTALVDQLLPSPALTLSIGCGSGLFEARLLQYMEKNFFKPMNLCGVEVMSCTNKYLSGERMLRVPSTTSLHPEAMLASALMFVYPRKADIVAMYIDALRGGALETVLWLGHRSDWPDIERGFHDTSCQLELVDGPGLSEAELLAIATMPTKTHKNT